MAMRSSFSWRGVVLLATLLSSSMTLPPVVLEPTAVTSMRALPSVTREPANSDGFSEFFLKGSDSPVAPHHTTSRGQCQASLRGGQVRQGRRGVCVWGG
jgi:hypothetical protein